MAVSQETAGFYWDGCILWLAYHYSESGNVYVEGWDMEGRTGGSLLSLVRRCLDSQFAGGFCANFIKCDKAYIDSSMGLRLAAVFEEFFSSINIPLEEVVPKTRTLRQINARWAEPLGSPVKATEVGYQKALSVLSSVIPDRFRAR